MSITVPDHKIALREYLRSRPAVLAVLAPGRIVGDYQDVVDGGHWLVLSRSGGSRDLEVPLRRARLDLTAYGSRRWEAVRLMHHVAEELGLNDPRRTPYIHSTGVIITDIVPDGDEIDGIDDRIPDVKAVPFVTQAVLLTVQHEGED